MSENDWPDGLQITVGFEAKQMPNCNAFLPSPTSSSQLTKLNTAALFDNWFKLQRRLYRPIWSMGPGCIWMQSILFRTNAWMQSPDLWNILEEFSSFLINFGSAPYVSWNSSISPLRSYSRSSACVVSFSCSFSQLSVCPVTQYPRPSIPGFVTFSVSDDGVGWIIVPTAIICIDKDQTTPGWDRGLSCTILIVCWSIQHVLSTTIEYHVLPDESTLHTTYSHLICV